MKKRKYTKAAGKNADTFGEIKPKRRGGYKRAAKKTGNNITDKIAVTFPDRDNGLKELAVTNSGLKEREFPSFRAAQIVLEDKVSAIKNQIKQETIEIRNRDEKLQRKRDELYNLENELKHLRRYNES